MKFHDGMPEDPDIDALSDGAFRLYVSAVCYAQREQTDGLVPIAKLRRLVPEYDPALLTELTRDAGHKDGPLFRACGDAVLIRNFAKYNRTRDYWEAQAAAAAERKAKWKTKNQ